jgi:SH3-like domain-containing protein
MSHLKTIQDPGRVLVTLVLFAQLISSCAPEPGDLPTTEVEPTLAAASEPEGPAATSTITATVIAEAEPSATPGGKILSDITDGANVRAGAGTDAAVISLLRASQEFTIIGRNGDWWKIRLSDGREGFVSASLVSANPAAQEIRAVAEGLKQPESTAAKAPAPTAKVEVRPTIAPLTAAKPAATVEKAPQNTSEGLAQKYPPGFKEKTPTCDGTDCQTRGNITWVRVLEIQQYMRGHIPILVVKTDAGIGRPMGVEIVLDTTAIAKEPVNTQKALHDSLLVWPGDSSNGIWDYKRNVWASEGLGIPYPNEQAMPNLPDLIKPGQMIGFNAVEQNSLSLRVSF